MVDLSVTTSMVPRTLLQMLALPDVAVSWKWGVMLPTDIPEPIEGLGIPSDHRESNTLWNKLKDIANKVANNANKVENQISTASLCLRAESINIPMENVQSTTSRTQARLRNFPDQIQVNSLDITFYEDYNYTALTYFTKWQMSIVNEYGVFRIPGGNEGYARDIYAYLFDTVGLLKGTVKFENCYPEQISGLDFNSESNAIKIRCTFSVQGIKWSPQPLLNLGATGAVGKTVIQNITSGQYGDTIKAGIKGFGSLF